MYKRYYFLGIGGIGMSAVARYFHAKGFCVAGYDRTSSQLTKELEAEGIAVCYDDAAEQIPPQFLDDARETLVVYTPAIPHDNCQMGYFRELGCTICKRAEILGQITRMARGLCVAGTHGKTTTSTMTAHILKQSHVDCNAFLGGIAKDYSSNLMLSDKSDLVVIEADEFDRSFHHLSPYMAVVTSTDADHLDIYGTHAAYLESFAHFSSLIQDDGVLIVKKGVRLDPRCPGSVRQYSYSSTERADFYAENIRLGQGRLVFDFVTPWEAVRDIDLGVPVLVNVENAVAAMALCYLNGVTADELRSAMSAFSGIRRRFDFHWKSDRMVIIDDYAHHYVELEASLRSVKALYADRKWVVIFQPHLYSRTNDFYHEFARSLSVADQVVLVEIYPAREEPIPGVTSRLIYDEITSSVKRLTTKEELVATLRELDFDVILTVGAGDIDTYIPRLVEAFGK